MAKGILWFSRVYIVCGVLFAFWRAAQGDFLLLAFVIMATPIAVVARAFIVKRVLVAALLPSHFQPASPGEFPLLDRAKMDELTRLWEELGFVSHGEFRGFGKTPPFFRLLAHPTEGALVEISQIFLLKRAFPVASGAFSYWGEAAPALSLADEIIAAQTAAAPLSSPDSRSPAREIEVKETDLSVWSYGTHTRAPNGFARLLSHPRVLGTRLPPETAPAEVWRVHLERRTILSARIPAPRLEHDLIAVLQSHAVVYSAITRARLRRTAIGKFVILRKPAATESLGEFGG